MVLVPNTLQSQSKFTRFETKLEDEHAETLDFNRRDISGRLLDNILANILSKEMSNNIPQIIHYFHSVIWIIKNYLSRFMSARIDPPLDHPDECFLGLKT